MELIKQRFVDLKQLKKQKHFYLDTKDYSGWGPLHNACYHEYNLTGTDKNVQYIYKNKVITGKTYKRIDLIKYLINNGVNVNAQTTNGYTPLHILPKTEENKDIIRLFVQNGANINLSNTRGETVFMQLVRKFKDIEFIQEFEHLVNVFMFKEKKKNELVESNYFVFVYLYPKYVDKLEDFENTKKDLVKKVGLKKEEREQIIKELESKIKYMKKILKISKKRFLKTPKKFVKKNEKMSIKKEIKFWKKQDDMTKYNDYMKDKDVKIVHIEYRKITTAKEIKFTKIDTPFLLGCKYLKDKEMIEEMIELMVKKKIVWNIKDENKENCLHHLIPRGFGAEFIMWVIKKDKRLKRMLNEKNDNGVTPFHLACQYISEYSYIHKMILSYFAKAKLVDNEDNTVLHYAAFFNNKIVYNGFLKDKYHKIKEIIKLIKDKKNKHGKKADYYLNK